MKRIIAILAVLCVGLVTLEIIGPSDHGLPGLTAVLAGVGAAVLVAVAKVLGRWLQRPRGADD